MHASQLVTFESILEHMLPQRDMTCALLVASVEDDAVLEMKLRVYKNPHMETMARRRSERGTKSVDFSAKDIQLLLLIRRLRFQESTCNDSSLGGPRAAYSELELHLLRAILVGIVTLTATPRKVEQARLTYDYDSLFPLVSSDVLRSLDDCVFDIFCASDDVSPTSVLDDSYVSLTRASAMADSLFQVLEMPQIFKSCAFLFQEDNLEFRTPFASLFSGVMYFTCVRCPTISSYIVGSLVDTYLRHYLNQGSSESMDSKWLSSIRTSILLCLEMLFKNENTLRAVEHELVTHLPTLQSLDPIQREPLFKILIDACIVSDTVRDAMLPSTRKLVIHKDPQHIGMGIQSLASLLRCSSEHTQIDITNTLLHCLGLHLNISRLSLSCIRDTCLADLSNPCILRRNLVSLSTKVCTLILYHSNKIEFINRPQVNAKLRTLFVSHENNQVMFSPMACVVSEYESAEQVGLALREDVQLLVQVSFIIECLIQKYDGKLISPPSLISDDENSKSSSVLAFYCQGIKNYWSNRDQCKSAFVSELKCSGQKSEMLVNCFAYLLLKAFLHCLELGYAIGIFDGVVGTAYTDLYISSFTVYPRQIKLLCS